MTTKSKSARIIALALLILPVHLRCGLALGADALEKPIAAPAEEGPARPSNPGGTGPAVSLTGPAWGDSKILEPQQLADLIAYIVLLNKAPTPGAQSSP